MTDMDGTEALRAADGRPVAAPGLEPLWEAVIDVAPRRSLGMGPLGERRIVPILGGGFRGLGAHAGLRGRVLPGGADRQLLRADGMLELDAVYEMETEDGAVLGIRNRVLLLAREDVPRHPLCQLQVTAPEGPYGWINRRALVGTLDVLAPARSAVLVRVFGMTREG